MILVLSHTQWMLKELWRQPAYVVSTVFFPALFYMIFALPESKDPAAANFLLASFSGFAVFGVFFLQIGVSLAQERSRSWYAFVKLLPVHGWQLFLARLLTATVFSLIAVLVLGILFLWQTDGSLNSGEILRFAVALSAGGILFCLMGIALGLWVGEKAALPVGNLIYLPLSFAGGLWKPPALLPESVRDFSEYLPTRYFGEALWTAVKGEWAAGPVWTGMLSYALIFALISVLGFRRETSRGRS